MRSFLLKKKRAQTRLLFFSLSFFFLHHRKSKQNKPLMIRGSRNTKHKNSPKFLECICLKKTPKVLSSRHLYASKKTKEMVKITKSTRSLFLSCGSFSLLLSLSFVPTLRFLRVRILSLSPFALRSCVRLCARVCVSRAA